MAEHLRVERFAEAGRNVLMIAGELDIATAEAAERAIAEPFELLDLERLEFIDSIGMRVLIRACAQREDPLPVRGVQPAVRRVIDLAGLLDKFAFIDAETDRSASLN